MIVLRFLIILISLVALKSCAAQKVPYFRILAPQFLCSSRGTGTTETNNTDSDYVPPSSITVALQTRGSERLIYRVQVYFKLLDGFRSQRHTLSVWRSIRVLEKKIRDTKEDISLKNQIDILNEELVPGVEYTFNIVGVDDEGNVSPAQNFTITYRGADAVGFDQESGSSGGDISFLLVGTWSIYRNMPFLMQGVIIFCHPTPSYEFHWSMSGLKGEAVPYVDTQSKTLFLPAGLLASGSSHDVSVEVLSKGSMIAKAQGTLNVIPRDFYIQLVPNNQSIGINRGIVYTVYLDNYEPNLDKVAVTWQCTPQSPLGQCNTKNKTFSTTFSFSKSGLYTITATLTLNGVTKKDSAFVRVLPDIIASVGFTTIDPFKIVAGKSFTAQVRIDYLIPQCSAEWLSIANEPEYEFLNANQVEGGFGRMELQDLEANFLSELIEYENDTTSYHLTLKVPESTGDFKGFVGNGVYLFRLLIQCPGLVDDDANGTQDKPNISSYTDLILRSNDPPMLEELEVSPRNGSALMTLFKFSTAPALDSPGDYPMRYKFYYFIDTFWVLIGDFYENTVIAVELPYSKTRLRTMYEVCDSRNACASVNGPDVEVTMIKAIVEGDLRVKMESVEGSLKRKDYDEFFDRSVCLTWTIYTWADNEQKNVLNKFFGDILNRELKDLEKGLKSLNMYDLNMIRIALEKWDILATRLINQHLRDQIRELLDSL